MPIEYEMKYLYDVAVDAISKYSEDHTAAYWFINIEDHVLRGILQNDQYMLSCFKPYQITVMKELIHRNMWIKWSEKEERPVLSSDPIYKIRGFDDSKPIPSGAD